MITDVKFVSETLFAAGVKLSLGIGIFFPSLSYYYYTAHMVFS